jgi:hypothetical protein
MRKRKRIRMNEAMPALRERRLRALGVQPLRLRRTATADVPVRAEVPISDELVARVAPPAPVVATTGIRRLALQPDPVELDDPVIRSMYAALTEAVGKAGLQRVRVCDVAGDPTAAVMVFGAAPLPEGVPMLRVLRVDPLRVLHADRERKRLLWERMQSLGRGAGG